MRPPVPSPAPAGFHWNVRVDPDWTTKPEVIAGRRCRYFVREYVPDLRQDRPVAHRIPAVAALRRGRKRPSWWGYCAEHLYGRWIDGPGPFEGFVVGYVLREDTK